MDLEDTIAALDQGDDTRDTMLYIRDLCARASALGIEVGPIMREVAELSSDADPYGMGSMKWLLAAYSPAD
jgi:hypothetical protein